MNQRTQTQIGIPTCLLDRTFLFFHFFLHWYKNNVNCNVLSKSMIIIHIFDNIVDK